MKKKITNEKQLLKLKRDDRIYNDKKSYSVFNNNIEGKELQLKLLGEIVEIDLGIGEYQGSISPLKKSYSEIIEDDSWQINK